MSKMKKWIQTGFQALSDQECILLRCLLKVSAQDGFLRALETILIKNCILLLRITKQTVFGLPMNPTLEGKI